MSAQVTDIIIINGEKQPLYSLPLTPYFDRHARPPRMFCWNRNFQRAYQATWEIGEEKLYLVNF